MNWVSWRIAFIMLVLTGCSASLQRTSPTEVAIFSDASIDKAALSLTSETEEVVPRDLGALPDGEELSDLTPTEFDPKELTTQAVLPGTNGFVYSIRYAPGTTNSWSIQRANQATDEVTTIYAGVREIQSVGGSLDGGTLVLSMRETTTVSSDFEVYKLTLATLSVQQLTSDTVDNTNISLSANGLTMAWQQPVSGLPKIVLRIYDNATTTTFRQKILFSTATTPSLYPSLSSDGFYIAFIRVRTDGLDQVGRYSVQTNTSVAITSSSTTATRLEHPSVSNNGTRVVWLQKTTGSSFIRLRDIPANTTQTVSSSSKTLEHPYITADGQYMTFGYGSSLPATSINVYVQNLNTGEKTSVRWSTNLQFGMVWMKATFQANEQQLAVDQFNLAFTSISGNTATASGENGTYILEHNTQGNWQIIKRIPFPEPIPHTDIPVVTALSGDTLVMGYSGTETDIDADGFAEMSVGAAYVFERNQGGTNNWGLVKKLINSDQNVSIDDFTGIGFGKYVTIDKDTIVVSASINIGDSFYKSAAYIFERNQGGINNWGQTKKLNVNLTATEYEFGIRLALLNNTLIVGTTGYVIDGIRKPATFVFERNQGGTNNWGEVKQLFQQISLPSEYSSPGASGLSISGDIAVVDGVDSYDANTNGTIECSNFIGPECGLGVLYIFSRNQGGTNNWGLEKKVIPSDYKGENSTAVSVAISGTRAVLGINCDFSLANLGSSCPTGAIYVFQRDKGGIRNWGQESKLLPSTTTNGRYFGDEIALENSTLLTSGASTTFGEGITLFFYRLD